MMMTMTIIMGIIEIDAERRLNRSVNREKKGFCGDGF